MIYVTRITKRPLRLGFLVGAYTNQNFDKALWHAGFAVGPSFRLLCRRKPMPVGKLMEDGYFATPDNVTCPTCLKKLPGGAR